MDAEFSPLARYFAAAFCRALVVCLRDGVYSINRGCRVAGEPPPMRCDATIEGFRVSCADMRTRDLAVDLLADMGAPFGGTRAPWIIDETHNNNPRPGLFCAHYRWSGDVPPLDHASPPNARDAMAADAPPPPPERPARGRARANGSARTAGASSGPGSALAGPGSALAAVEPPQLRAGGGGAAVEPPPHVHTVDCAVRCRALPRLVPEPCPACGGTGLCREDRKGGEWCHAAMKWAVEPPKSAPRTVKAWLRRLAANEKWSGHHQTITEAITGEWVVKNGNGYAPIYLLTATGLAAAGVNTAQIIGYRGIGERVGTSHCIYHKDRNPETMREPMRAGEPGEGNRCNACRTRIGRAPFTCDRCHGGASVVYPCDDSDTICDPALGKRKLCRECSRGTLPALP